MRQSDFGRHDDHLMKRVSVALVIAVIGGSVVDSLVGAATPSRPIVLTPISKAQGNGWRWPAKEAQRPASEWKPSAK
jgi:hypothetical protein